MQRHALRSLRPLGRPLGRLDADDALDTGVSD